MSTFLNTISIIATYIVVMFILYFIFLNLSKLLLKPKVVQSVSFNLILFLILNIVLFTQVEFHKPW